MILPDAIKDSGNGLYLISVHRGNVDQAYKPRYLPSQHDHWLPSVMIYRVCCFWIMLTRCSTDKAGYKSQLCRCKICDISVMKDEKKQKPN